MCSLVLVLTTNRWKERRELSQEEEEEEEGKLQEFKLPAVKRTDCQTKTLNELPQHSTFSCLSLCSSLAALLRVSEEPWDVLQAPRNRLFTRAGSRSTDPRGKVTRSFIKQPFSFWTFVFVCVFVWNRAWAALISPPRRTRPITTW